MPLLGLALQQAQAACSLTPGPGVDSYVCFNGSSATGLTGLVGDNTLALPAGGAGTINGNIVSDQALTILTWTPAALSAASPRAIVSIAFASVLARSRALSQGNGIDDFVMSGGQIQSLAQGDGRDTFLITGGTIIGAFEDGDVARQAAGTIGRVDMKLDDNIYDMSGGSILGNLLAGFGTDRIIVSGGSIGGNISVSGGDDSNTVSGSVINGEIRASVGNDTFNWLGGGEIKSQVLMGDGNDIARLSGLTESL
ncbi:Outer membrane autotransporter barrel domain protein [Pseudomonas synxantha]|uniref:Outer membrane autotransporter barrel domain protein n=1 Tax=Pseudomonas synxantha TaxID=47883 RepID=A0A3G7UC68_9PSED|nr:Outer membrane autotransporter barrel domain protein [Pseudomonas synxantha]